MRLPSSVLLLIIVFGSVGKAQDSQGAVGCQKHLDLARSYEAVNDSRAEKEFRLAISKDEKRCSQALLELSQHLSRNLRFGESADALQKYVKLTPRDDHRADFEEVRTLRNAANIKTRVDSNAVPQLQDLIDVARLSNSFGRSKAHDALPYAEKAVALYPTSIDSIMLLAEILLPVGLDNNRVELLLNQAIALDPNVPTVRSTLGWFYLFLRGRREDAQIQFRKALELSEGKDPVAWKGLGYIYMFSGQRKEALTHFRKYQSLLKKGESDGDVSMAIAELETKP